MTLFGGARTELLNWSGGVPLLATVLCNRLWDGATSGSELTNESVNAVAESLLDSNSAALKDLWRSFDGEQQRLLAEIVAGTDASEDTNILRPLVDAGVIVVAKKRFAIPSRILAKYAAGEHGRVGSGFQKLFADREPFETNIRSILEFRHLQMKGMVDEEIWDHIQNIIEKLDKPHIVIGAPRAILNRAFELIWKRELPDRNIPGEWTREFASMTDKPPQGKIPTDIGFQCRILDLMTSSNCAVNTRISRYTYSLLNGLPAPGNIGSHLLKPSAFRGLYGGTCILVPSACRPIGGGVGLGRKASSRNEISLGDHEHVRNRAFSGFIICRFGSIRTEHKTRYPHL